MSTFETELYTYEDGALVIAEVEFEHTKDSDFRAHGEHGSWVDTSFREIIRITYIKDGQPYKPTKGDLCFWGRQIEREMNSREVA